MRSQLKPLLISILDLAAVGAGIMKMTEPAPASVTILPGKAASSPEQPSSRPTSHFPATASTPNRKVEASLPQETWQLFTEDNLYAAISRSLAKDQTRVHFEVSDILSLCGGLVARSKLADPRKSYIKLAETDSAKRAVDQLLRRCASLPQTANGLDVEFFDAARETTRRNHPLNAASRSGVRLEHLSAILATREPLAIERFYYLLGIAAASQQKPSLERPGKAGYAMSLAAAIAMCDMGMDRCDDADSKDFRVLTWCATDDFCQMTRRQQLQQRLDKAMPAPAGKEAERKTVQDNMIASIKRQISERL